MRLVDGRKHGGDTMLDEATLQTQMITCGRELPLEERFCYRAIRSWVFKTTPQTELQIHVHFPHDWRATDHRPAIVFFFGGGLLDGTVEQFARQAVYLTGRGMVVARADYRLIPKHGVTADRCVADAKSAVRWMRSHAAELGVDPNRIASGGGSAGGFLAAATGILPGLDEPDEDATVSSRPNLLVLYNPAFGIYSETNADFSGAGDELGAMLRLGLAPTAALAQQLNVTAHLTSDAPPMWVWFGTEDYILQLSQGFLERARSLGCNLELLLTEGCDHAFYNDYMLYYRETLVDLVRFLESRGYLDA
jgi:acetyl esterase